MGLKRLRELQESLEVYGELDEDRGRWSSDMERNRDAMRAAMRGNIWSTHPSSRTTREKSVPKRRSSDPSSNYRSNLSMKDRAELAASARKERKSGEDYDGEEPTKKKIKKASKLALLTKNPKKLRKQNPKGNFSESYNIYDILISHLLDEGYADDVKNAYCILENMSEDWVLEILDEAKWIQKAIKHPGAFSKKAQQHDMSPQEFAGYVSSHPEKFGTRTERQANLARTLKKISKD